MVLKNLPNYHLAQDKNCSESSMKKMLKLKNSTILDVSNVIDKYFLLFKIKMNHRERQVINPIKPIPITTAQKRSIAPVLSSFCQNYFFEDATRDPTLKEGRVYSIAWIGCFAFSNVLVASLPARSMMTSIPPGCLSLNLVTLQTVSSTTTQASFLWSCFPTSYQLY